MNILIADDHKIVREGLKQIIRQIPEVNMIDEAFNGRDALSKSNSFGYDLVLLDISLPDISGLEVLRTIKTKKPEQNVLVLSMHSHEQYALRTLKLGAAGYLTKDAAAEELILAIQKIGRGGRYISAALAENLASFINENKPAQLHETLSEREFEILLKIAVGRSLKEIGDELFISSKTVSTYRSRILEKMKMKNNAEIAHYCIKLGLID